MEIKLAFPGYQFGLAEPVLRPIKIFFKTPDCIWQFQSSSKAVYRKHVATQQVITIPKRVHYGLLSLLGRRTLDVEAAYCMDRRQLSQPVQAVFEPPHNISLVIPRIEPQGAEVIHNGRPPALLISKHQRDKLGCFCNSHQHCFIGHYLHFPSIPPRGVPLKCAAFR